MKVWVNGTFDVVHIGHIRLLQYAKSFGNLRVGIDTDLRVKTLKGKERPYNNLEDRIEFLKSIKWVDDIVTFSSDEELINQIKLYTPDIMVIGGDYRNKEIIGGELINKILYFDRIGDYSTSNILSYENSSHR
jgi:D-beta-D-heptose 7-phosphate kinase/D-beta-D-heptose 1-phosphate adenosyltransferase